MVQRRQLRWWWILLYPIALRIFMILLTFPYMMIYAALINPGMEESFYQEYVFDNRGWISTFIGLPVFYGACYLMGKKIKVDIVRNCMLMVLVYALSDIPLEYVVGDLSEWTLMVAHASKLFVGYFGAVTAMNAVAGLNNKIT